MVEAPRELLLDESNAISEVIDNHQIEINEMEQQQPNDQAEMNAMRTALAASNMVVDQSIDIEVARELQLQKL